MSKMREFDNILDECLQRLIEGDSVEACLSRYPQYAAELEPLLRTAQDALKATAIEPRPEFRDRARYQFLAALREMETRQSRGFFGWVPRWATVVSIIVIILAAGSGTVAASAGSLPGEPLYQVKLATESVRLALTPSALGKAELHASFADERVNEIIKIAKKGNAELIEKTTDRMSKQLLAVASLTATGEVTVGDTQFSALRAPAAVTATPMPTVVPTPMPAPTPTLMPVPPPQITITASDEEAPFLAAEQAPGPEEEAGNDRENGEKDGGGKSDKHEKLKNNLTQQALKNLQALRDELEKAPESLKPALRHAIEVAEKAYAEALASLGN